MVKDTSGWGKSSTPRPYFVRDQETSYVTRLTRLIFGSMTCTRLPSCAPALSKCRFHDLRHTAVTRLLEAGIPYPVVASMMGWFAATAIRMAKALRAHGSKALRDAAEVLGRLKIAVESLKNPPKSLETQNASIQQAQEKKWLLR